MNSPAAPTTATPINSTAMDIDTPASLAPAQATDAMAADALPSVSAPPAAAIPTDEEKLISYDQLYHQLDTYVASLLEANADMDSPEHKAQVNKLNLVNNLRLNLINRIKQAKELLKAEGGVVALLQGSTHVVPGDKHRIAKSDLPVFNIDPLLELSNNANRSAFCADSKLEVFVRSFERVHLEKKVDVTLHWLKHLEISFEANHFKWFVTNIKSPCLKSKGKMTWRDAISIMRSRFDMASNTNIAEWHTMIASFSYKKTDTFNETLYRFKEYLVGSQINLSDNRLVGYTFLNGLPTAFRKIVVELLQNHMKYNGTTPVDVSQSIWSKKNPIFGDYVPQDFEDLERILSENMLTLEAQLVECHHQGLKRSSASSSSEDRINYNSKKQRNNGKYASSSVPSSSHNGKNPHAPSHSERAQLRAAGKCTFCREDYNDNHKENCQPFQAFVRSRNQRKN